MLAVFNNNDKDGSTVSYTQGGESHVLYCLFCTCIPIGYIRKLFITSLILNKFSSCKRTSKYFILLAVVFYTTSSKDIQSLLEVVWKNTESMETALR